MQFFWSLYYWCHLTQYFNVSGHVQDLPRASRSRVTARAQDNRLWTQHLKDRYRPATRTATTTIGNHSRPISAQTVVNSLSAQTYVNRLRASLDSFTSSLCWLTADVPVWNDVGPILDDRQDNRTGSYSLMSRDSPWIDSGECFSDPCVKEADRFRGGSVMVWTEINNDRKIIDGIRKAQR